LPDTLKLLNPKLYQQYADGLTKLMGGLHTFKIASGGRRHQ